MPYFVKQSFGKFCVAEEETGLVIKGGCHLAKKDAEDQIKAIYASKHKMAAEQVELEARISELEMLLGQYSAAVSALDATGSPEADLRAMEALTASGAETVPWSGDIAIENVPTGDNRVFASGSITWEEPPLPLLWQRVSAEGHKSSVVIGRVDEISRHDDVIKAQGIIFTGADAPEEANQYRYLIENGAAGGVSVDGDTAHFDLLKNEDGSEQVSFNKIRIRALTAVAIPAFAEASIELNAEALARKAKKKLISERAHTWQFEQTEATEETEEVEPAEQNSILASAVRVKPPIEWFENPRLDSPTPLTVSQDGWVFGHIALFNTCHIGLPGCTKPPKNGTYEYFHTGEIETDQGDSVEVGHLTFKTGHAGHQLSAKSAAAHYDHTGMVGADVRAGEDQHGIWVAGALRPHLTDQDIREFRAAPISGDWRRINSRMEMVGALSVNVPGFPVPRKKISVLTAGGEPQTLIYSEDFDELPEEPAEPEFSRIEVEARKALRAELNQKVLTTGAIELVS